MSDLYEYRGSSKRLKGSVVRLVEEVSEKTRKVEFRPEGGGGDQAGFREGEEPAAGR